MVLRTIVKIVLHDTAVSPRFFEELDRCFLEISCTPAPDWQIRVIKPDDVMLLITREQAVQRVLYKDDSLFLQYLNRDTSDFCDVCIHCTGHMIIGDILIDSRVCAFQTEYTEEERAYALRLQRVSELIHTRLNALETKAMVDFNDDPWFHFTKDTWELIDHLPLKRDHHMFDLALRHILALDEEFYFHLDGCFVDCGYVPWRARLIHKDHTISRIPWAERSQAPTKGYRLFLIYRHTKFANGFVDVSMGIEENTVDRLGLDVYLPPDELSGSQIDGTLAVLSDSLRRIFGGKYWSIRESRCEWSTE